MSPLAEVLPNSGHITEVGRQSEVGRVATPSVLAEVLDLQGCIGDGADEEGVSEAVGADTSAIHPAHARTRIVEESTISSFGEGASPIPASSIGIELDTVNESVNGSKINGVNNQSSCHGTMVQQKERVVKCILYYTDNRLDPKIMKACQIQIEKSGLPIISVSRKPLDFGHNIVLKGRRSALQLHRQILAGLEVIDADVVFFAEHDVLYHPSHWDFTPKMADRFYYNTNVWKVRMSDGHAVWTDDLQQTSGLCASRSLLLEQYRRRVKEIEKKGFDRHYEPGEKTGPWKSRNWKSKHPNLDIRHGNNLTRAKWHPSEFRNKQYAKGWREADAVPPWYEEGKFQETLFDS